MIITALFFWLAAFWEIKARKSIHAIDMCAIFLRVTAAFGFILCRLRRGARFELAGDELEVVGYLDAAFQEEEFEIPGFVFELDLIAVFEDFVDCSAGAEHRQDLAPVRSFDAVQTGH